jgi:adenylate cyclase
MPTPGDRPDPAALQRRLLVTPALLGVPNLTAAVLVFVFQNFLMTGSTDTGPSLQRTISAFVVYVIVAFPIAGMFAFLLLRPIRTWLAASRGPTPEELDATLEAPRRMGGMGFAFWLGALVVFGALALIENDGAREIVGDAIATLLGGLTAAMLSILLVESWLRPVAALALGGSAPPRRFTAGIAPRILLSWALGSGVPLLGIVMAYVRFTAEDPAPSTSAVVFLALLGLSTGALLLALAAKSVAQPIGDVRAALSRVQRGDTDVEVEVDNAGEIGQLQGGFNEMVQGLRERRRLEDLFGRYVGSEVANDALERGVGLGGEERVVSALFVDIIRSTDFAHRHSPGEVVDTFNDFFATVVGVITAAGGWVNKFQGDGALCVFGAPGDQPDHATRALRAARQLRIALDELHVRRPTLSAAIGVSTGTVVAGNVGAVERFEYTVIGDPVNEAARLTEAAKDTPRCVLASATSITDAGADEQMHWQRSVDICLRGRAVPTEAWMPAA